MWRTPRSNKATAPALGIPFTSFWMADWGLHLLPQIFRQPVDQFLPLPAVERGGLIQRQRGNVELSRSHGLQELVAALRRGFAPPIVDGKRRFGRPAELVLLRSPHGRQHGVDGDVDVPSLEFAADRGMIGETVVAVAEMDQIKVLDSHERSSPLFPLPLIHAFNILDDWKRSARGYRGRVCI